MDAIRLKKLETRMVKKEDESWMHPTNPGCIQDESISGWMHPKIKYDIIFRKYRNVLSTRNRTSSNTKLVWFAVEAVNLAWNPLTIWMKVLCIVWFSNFTYFIRVYFVCFALVSDSRWMYPKFETHQILISTHASKIWLIRLAVEKLLNISLRKYRCFPKI